MGAKDIYKTILRPSEEVLHKDKNSKFYGYAFPVSDDATIKSHLEELKKLHHTAGHHCYAYQIGTNKTNYRANDDGEPNHSAGMPIYGQIQSFELTNILVVVVRYFGGTKLGVGGLINAYKTAAKMALEASLIKTKTINVHFNITFDYKNMNKVMRIIKEKQLNIVSQTLELNCQIEISVRKSIASSIFKSFEALHKVDIKEL